MLRIRLVAGGADDVDGPGISSRLRGAMIASDASPLALPEQASGESRAVVFIGRQPLKLELIEQSLRAGEHVLLATEPCFSQDVLESLSNTARRAGAQFAVVNPDRYLPSRQLLKQQLVDKLGAAALVRIHRWEPVAADGLSGGSSPSPAACRGLPGPLVRDLELTLWLVARPPNLVYAVESLANESDAPHRQSTMAGRFVQVHLGFAEGMALIDYDNRLPPGDRYHSLSVIGASGAAYADDHQNMQLLYRGGLPQAVRTEEGIRQFATMLQEFVDALAAGRDLSATVTAWRDVEIVADAVRQSLDSKQAIPLEGR